jgi:hypothetical protein
MFEAGSPCSSGLPPTKLHVLGLGVAGPLSLQDALRELVIEGKKTGVTIIQNLQFVYDTSSRVANLEADALNCTAHPAPPNIPNSLIPNPTYRDIIERATAISGQWLSDDRRPTSEPLKLASSTQQALKQLLLSAQQFNPDLQKACRFVPQAQLVFWFQSDWVSLNISLQCQTATIQSSIDPKLEQHVVNIDPYADKIRALLEH